MTGQKCAVLSTVPGTERYSISDHDCELLYGSRSVTKSSPTLCNPMDRSTAGSCVLPYLLELAQIHVHWVGDAIPPSHPLLPTSPFAFNLSQHQGLL